MFCERNKTMMMQNSRTVRRRVDANEQARERAKTTPLRNEAQLNCVSLRSELDDEVTCGAVKGQDERQLRAPLTAPQVTTVVYASSGRELVKDGRHVGLDFYDLLIEALMGRCPGRCPMKPRLGAR